MIVRISKGRIAPNRTSEVEQALHDGRASLHGAIAALDGLIAFYAAIDPHHGYMTNTSLWESLEAAEQMSELPEMLTQRARFEALDVQFETITNHDVLWEVVPAEEV
jgi:hypothetical protein